MTRHTNTHSTGSARRRPTHLVLTLLAAALALFAFASPASADKVVVDVYGPQGTLGGQFGNPQGIAVNQTGAGGVAPGTIYVVDGNEGSVNTDLNRIQRLAPDGDFERAWGYDIAGRDERQLITIRAGAPNGLDSGSFTLRFGADTATLTVIHQPLQPQAEAVRSALEALPSIGAGNVHVTGGLSDNSASVGGTAGGAFAIRFIGALSGTDVSQIAIDGSRITGVQPITTSASTIEDGSGSNTTGFEICTVAANCQGNPLTQATANGGQLNSPSAIAVNQSSGDVYVLNSNHSRIDQFDADGNFIRAWGRDVVISGRAEDVPGTNERQTVTLPAAANGGTFRLDYPFIGGSTSSIPFNATASQVRSALEGLAAIGTGDVDVTSPNPGGGAGPGGPYAVEFTAGLADTNVNQISSDPSGLTVSSGAKTIAHATAVNGAGNFEICTVAADCKKGAGNSDGGSLPNALRLALDLAGNVWVGSFSNRRFEQFRSDGRFIAAYGWNVDALGGAGGLERCVSTAPGACQVATQGSALGQFGDSPGAFAFDAAGNLYAVDGGNSRIQRFDPTLISATLFASALSGLSSFNSRLLALPGGHLLVDVFASGERRLLDLDSSGTVTETSLTDAGVRSLNGLARNDSTGTIYATTTTSISPPTPVDPHVGILVIDDGPVPPPLVTLDAITTFDEATATFSGSVDPDGLTLFCKFQYSTDQVNWTDIPEPGCASFNPGGGPQAVSEDVTGLQPGTHYFVRLVATRPYNPSATFDEEEFTTPSLPPIVSDLGAVKIADTSAYLVGAISPRSQSTDYHFEYTTTDFTDCGLSANPNCLETPETEIVGSAEAIVSQQIVGLTPDTDYHFRLVATNVADTTESATEVFHTRAVPLPNPDDRGYEQVTPPAKNFTDIATQGSPAVAPDGQAASFPIISSLPDPPTQAWKLGTPNVARRYPDGWRIRGVNPPTCQNDPERTEFDQPDHPGASFSPDLERAVLIRPDYPNCTPAPLDSAAPPQNNLYLTELFADPPGYQLLTPQPAIGSVGPAFGGVGGDFAGASGDWSHILYSSRHRMTADAPAGSFGKIFDWHAGVLSLVSKGLSGSAFTTASSVAGAAALNAVSEDGSRIFFQNAGQVAGTPLPTELYLREGGTRTFWVSQSECTSSCGGQRDDRFEHATPDGSRALLTSAGKLTNADTSTEGDDLYLYAHSANPGSDPNLTLLSRDNEPADGTRAEVQGALGIGDDGETVYFAASGQLVAGGPIDFGPKLYRWRWNAGSPTLDYLGTLGSTESGNWGGSDRPDVRRVTPDGAHLLVETDVALDPLADTDEDRDVYRWNQAGDWACASCQLPGAASAGDSTFAGARGSGGAFANAMSADGQRVFFETADALVPADTNGLDDVYQWHDGALSLISSGIGTDDVEFAGTGLTGGDVFLLTRERLVGWDTDDANDLYDARIGGGFPEPPVRPAPCEGEACRGAGTSAPATTGAGSAVFDGAVDPPPTFRRASKRCPRSKRKVVRKGKTRCVAKKRTRSNRAAKHNRRTAR